MSLDDVAKVTKIQLRILERLEAGRLDGLPADVFVRGFVRSFARCVGLDEGEALRRHAACALGAAGSTDLTPTVRAIVDAMVDLAPGGPGASGASGSPSASRGPSSGASPSKHSTTPRGTPRKMLAVDVAELASATAVETTRQPEIAAAAMPAQPDVVAEATSGATSDVAAVAGPVTAPPSGTVEATAAGTTDTVTSSPSGAASGLAGDTTVTAPPSSTASALAGEATAAVATPPSSTASGSAGEATATVTAPPSGPTSGSAAAASETGAPGASATETGVIVTAPPGAWAAEAALLPSTGEAWGVGASPAVAVAAEPAPLEPRKRRRRGRSRKRASRISLAGLPRALAAMVAAPELPREAGSAPATGMPSSADTAASDPATAPGAAPDLRGERPRRNSTVMRAAAEPATPADEPIATGSWAPRMPPIAVAPSVPWRRPAYAASAALAAPSLVIDDADPDSAERVLEERAERLAPRRTFLPPILLDREDRSARQGGLTLAVILLLIAATLTLSYLMRRPSASGDGVTRRDPPVGDLAASVRG